MVQIYLSQGYEKKNRCHMFQNPGCPGSPSAGRPSGSIDEILSRPERDSSVDRCTMLLPTEENINEEGFPSKPPSHNDKDKEIPEKETLSHITHVRVNQTKSKQMKVNDVFDCFTSKVYSAAILDRIVHLPISTLSAQTAD